MRRNAVAADVYDVRFAVKGRFLSASTINTRVKRRSQAIIGAALVLPLAVACSSNSSSAQKSTSASTNATGVTTTAKAAGPTVSLRPVASKPVPPPSKGNIHTTVARRVVVTKAPVSLTAPGEFGTKVSARLVSIKSIKAQSHIPGEISGPALAISVEIDNGSATSIDLNGVAVAVTGKNNKPENQISQNGTVLLHGSLAAGKKSSGIYVFTVPVVDRSHLSVAISYTAAAPVVLFVGSVS